VVDGVVGAVLGTAAALVAFAVFPAEGGGMPEQDAWSSPAASGDWFESVSGSLPAWEPGQLAVLGAFGLLALAVFWPLSAFKGVTPGKAALGLRLAEFRTAQAPGLWPVFGRYLRIAGPGLVSELAVLAMTVAGANRTAVLALMAVAGLAGLGAIVAFVAMVVTIFQDRSTPRTWYDKGSGLWLTDIRASGIAGLISSGRAVAPADLGPPVQPSVPVQPAAPMQPNEPMAASSAGPVAPVPSATPAVRSGPALPASSSRPTGTVPGQSGLITAVPGITPAIRPDLTGPAGPGTPGDVFAAPPSPPPASHHSPGAPGLRPPPAAGSPAASGQAASAGPVPGRPRPPEQSEPPGPIGAPLDTSGFFAPAPVEPAPGPLGQPGAPMPPLDLGGDDEAGITRRSLTPGMPAATFVLSFDTGESVVVRGTGLVGRRPQPRRGEAVAVHLVPIQDAAMSVSKTHLAFGLAGGDLWVSDRQSTNGTVVVRRDGLEQVAAPGKAVIVRVGDRVRFGERSFQVREG
jgi:hypothetical protein